MRGVDRREIDAPYPALFHHYRGARRLAVEGWGRPLADLV